MNEYEDPDLLPDQPDRRREPRWELRGDVAVACWTGPSEADVALALIDVSSLGARLLVRDALEVGVAVAVYLYETSRAMGFLRAARVIWCAEARGGHHFAGVEFETPLDPEALEELRQFCRPGPP